MEELPEGGEGEDLRPQTVPIFPLPDVWLSPLALLPLHVFEPRYQQMIEDLLDGPGRLVMGTVVEGQDTATVPDVYPIAGLGEIGRHEKLEDGRFKIWVMGIRRVRVEEVPSDRLYRTVDAEPLVEIHPSGPEEKTLSTSLRRALDELIEEVPEEHRPPEKLINTLAVGSLADIVGSLLELDRGRRQEIFATLDTAERARMVLGEYAQMKLAEGDTPEDEPDEEPGASPEA